MKDSSTVIHVELLNILNKFEYSLKIGDQLHVRSANYFL